MVVDIPEDMEDIPAWATVDMEVLVAIPATMQQHMEDFLDLLAE